MLSSFVAQFVFLTLSDYLERAYGNRVSILGFLENKNLKTKAINLIKFPKEMTLEISVLVG